MGGSGFFGFREVVDLGQVLEIIVLGPERRLMEEGGGIDQGVGHGEFVAG